MATATATAPPPDFRYVGLEPAPSSLGLKSRAALAAAAVFGVGIALGGGMEPVTVAGASLVAAGTALLVARKAATDQGVSQVGVDYVAIVPWGILVHSNETPRVLRWGGVKAVEVRYIHEMDAATPLVRWSVVTIRTATETLVGRSPGCLLLDRLEAYLEDYAEEGGRAIALDFAGEQTLVSDFEPLFPRLLDQVRRTLSSPAEVCALGLASCGYRGGVSRQLSEPVLAQLECWLTNVSSSAFDRRPLAAMLAAELGAQGVLPSLMAHVTSPHPFVAAVARAAALKLGADLRHVGSLDELNEFVPEGELEALRVWSAGEERVLPRTS